MPYKGWRTVALRDGFYEQLEEKANKANRSVSNQLETEMLKHGIVTQVVTVQQRGRRRV